MLIKSASRWHRFSELAHAQRGAPEEAMLAIQRTRIAPLYAYVAEHVGDLTHRMSTLVEVTQGRNCGYGMVAEKVCKTLRSLTDPYGFEREVREQIESFADGTAYTPQEAEIRLRTAGKIYAEEHMKLPVFNHAQMTACDAAVAVGLFDFDRARFLLSLLCAKLDEGPEAWNAYVTASKPPACAK